jgi:diaminopimelate decarboxylase
MKNNKFLHIAEMEQIMKKTFINLKKLEEIASEIPTPFHLYDEKGIRENARKLKEAFAWNKGFKEYFAVKATPNPTILKILKEEGCGVDCSSITELMLAEMSGFHGEEIMFSSNVTPKADYIKATEQNAIINLDDITHIEFLENTTGLPELICCRYNPGRNFALNNEIMDTPEEAKYGFTFSQLVEGFGLLKAKGVKHFGIHAFLASNTIANEYYPALARLLFETAVELKKQTGIKIEFINLSGGIGIPYHPDQKAADILSIGKSVQIAFKDVLEPEGMGDISIFTELGRYMLGPYGSLITKTIHKKHIYKDYIGVDACSVDLLRPAMYKAYHHITVMGKEVHPLTHKYDITGGLCENNDKFAIDRMLPKIDIGDFIVIHDTGAHGYSMGYNYNGKLRSAEVLLKVDGTIKLIRRAETPNDYFSTLNIE